MKSTDILNKCAAIQHERGKEYNSEEGERSMDKIVAGFNAVTGQKLTVQEGWLFMGFLKLVRGISAPGHEDSQVDLVSYMSLYAESMLKKPQAPEDIPEAYMSLADFHEKIGQYIDALGVHTVRYGIRTMTNGKLVDVLPKYRKSIIDSFQKTAQRQNVLVGPPNSAFDPADI